MTNEQFETLIKTSNTVEDMHERLFGNGQPGILEHYDRRIKELEKSKFLVKGAMTVIGAVASWAGWPHVKELFLTKQ